MARAYIGTSGWSYRTWNGTFYPADIAAGRQLRYYAQHFDTVELNASFYRLLAPGTIHNWAATVPDGFIFAVKASKLITHTKRLHAAEVETATLLNSLAGFGNRLGPLLFQLPPGWKKDAVMLEAYLHLLPAGRRYAFEFRNRSWLDEGINSILRKHNIAYCIYDLGGFESPHVVTADFAYIRLHGPGQEKYIGSYSGAKLARWCGEIRSWLDSGLDVYCYFDNTYVGDAIFDVLELCEMLGLNIGKYAGLKGAVLPS